MASRTESWWALEPSRIVTFGSIELMTSISSATDGSDACPGVVGYPTASSLEDLDLVEASRRAHMREDSVGVYEEMYKFDTF